MAGQQFIPRVLGKHPIVPAKNPAVFPAAVLTLSNSGKTNSLTPAKDSPGIPHGELIAMANIMLSDYSLQHNPTLRRALEVQSSDGFIAFNSLFSLSPPCGITSLNAKMQSAIVQALRGTNSCHETRLILTEPDTFWTRHDFQSGSSKHATETTEASGYEIRRNDWKNALRGLGSLDRMHWYNLTIYVENLPRGLNTAPKIADFIQRQLLRFVSLDDLDAAVVQHVSFTPPSFIAGIDSERNIPLSPDNDRCHGFAFAILRDSKLVESIVNAWPWDPAISSGQIDVDTMTMEARRTGLRTLPIDQWVKLRDEYLGYQQLLEAAKAVHQTHYSVTAGVRESGSPTTDAAAASGWSNGGPQTQPQGPITNPAKVANVADMPTFPPGCLMFVKNLHPRTNKTTIKELLSRAFTGDASAEAIRDGSGIDYVDYQKNMDTCYIRLARPDLSSRLQKFFSCRTVYQSSSLDGDGREQGGSGDKPISVELVTGLKEKLYWDKLPEKVRQDAMRKAGHSDSNAENSVVTASGRKRHRKR